MCSFIKIDKKNDEVRGIFVLKNLKKSIFDLLCKTKFSKLVQILILHLKLGLHVHFHKNRYKNNVMGVFVKKKQKKIFSKLVHILILHLKLGLHVHFHKKL